MNALSSNPGHYIVLLLTVARGEVSVGSGSREHGHSTMNALSSNPGHYNVLLLKVARREVSVGSGSRELGHSTVIVYGLNPNLTKEIIFCFNWYPRWT